VVFSPQFVMSIRRIAGDGRVSHPPSLTERFMVSIISGIYVTAFRWWLEPCLTRVAERKLKKDVKRDLGFLFVKFAAHFVPNERKYRWGKVVTLAAEDAKIRVSLDRGEYGVALSPNIEPSEWVGVRDLLTAVIPEYVRPPYDPLSLSGWGNLLEPHFRQIEEAFRAEHYPVTRHNLEQGRANASAKMKAEVRAGLTAAKISE